jgi:two-component system OmpR family sensor kinase
MFDSMRAQLTLWYTGVLALVLVIFAVSTYLYLARATRERTDQSLVDTAHYLVSNFKAETEDENLSGAEAALEVTRDFQFSDRQAVILDDSGRMLAASPAPFTAQVKNNWPQAEILPQSMTGLLEESRQRGRGFATLPNQSAAIRAYAASIKSKGNSYTLIIAQSLDEQNRALEQARRSFYIAVPLALILASLGGYLLARKSLAPVVAMGARAARIGASNLGERLPVINERSEIGRLAQIFNALLARLDLSFEQQRRFMADASHELRTPVAIVCGESEVALSQSLRSAEEYRVSLSIMHDEGRRLTRIVEDLFMLARADAGQYQPDFKPFYIDETVGECVRALRSLAAKQGQEFHYTAPQDEMLFRGDEGLVRRMVLNLLDNAIKYTPRGGRIHVELERQESNYRIIISDTGAGIPPEAQQHIFERFYRVDKARSRNGIDKGSGAGLGLSIAAWIAELHGGSIALTSSSLRGSTFIISLPAAAA